MLRVLVQQHAELVYHQLIHNQPNRECICILKENNYGHISVYRESDDSFYSTYTDIVDALKKLREMYTITILDDLTQGGKNIYTALMESVKWRLSFTK